MQSWAKHGLKSGRLTTSFVYRRCAASHKDTALCVYTRLQLSLIQEAIEEPVFAIGLSDRCHETFMVHLVSYKSHSEAASLASQGIRWGQVLGEDVELCARVLSENNRVLM